MVASEEQEKPACSKGDFSAEVEAFGLIAPQMVGKDEPQLLALCDRLEAFVEGRREVQKNKSATQ